MELQKQISEINGIVEDSLKELEVLLHSREYARFIHVYQDSYENIEDTVFNIVSIIGENLPSYSEEDIEDTLIQLDKYTNKFMDRTAILIRNHVNEIEKMASR